MTLNQVIQEIKNIAATHRQINTFYFGELSEWVNFEGLKYVSCLLVLKDATMSPVQVEYNFSIYISDLLNSDGKNRTEVQSDTLSILKDLLSLFDTTTLDWTFVRTGSAVTFIDNERGNDNPDRVAGVKAEFTIAADMPSDKCQVPQRTAIITEEGFTLFTEDGQAITVEDGQTITSQDDLSIIE